MSDLTPKSTVPFTPTRIEDGARGSSRYAARFAGSGFTEFGAFMGFVLMCKGSVGAIFEPQR